MKHHFRIVSHKRRKQVISLLPTLSEKQGATYVFFLKHGSDKIKIYKDIRSINVTYIMYYFINYLQSTYALSRIDTLYIQTLNRYQNIMLIL